MPISTKVTVSVWHVNWAETLWWIGIRQRQRISGTRTQTNIPATFRPISEPPIFLHRAVAAFGIGRVLKVQIQAHLAQRTKFEIELPGAERKNDLCRGKSR